MDSLTSLFARTNDDELWGLILDSCQEVYGYERLVAADPSIPAPKVVTLFDVISTTEGMLNGGVSRFFTGSADQQRIIQAFREIGDAWTARLLDRALERVEERKREGCENPEDFRKDERLERLNLEVLRRHKDVQDAFGKFVRANFTNPEFFGEEFRAALLRKGNSG